MCPLLLAGRWDGQVNKLDRFPRPQPEGRGRGRFSRGTGGFRGTVSAPAPGGLPGGGARAPGAAASDARAAPHRARARTRSPYAGARAVAVTRPSAALR